MGFLHSVLYLGFLGIISYPVGRIISKFDPDPDGFFFREHTWELEGKIYENLNIKYWQARIPDISKVLRHRMPPKRLPASFTAETVRIMIRETCTAEIIHNLLNIAGLRLLCLWKGTGGLVLYLIYIFFGNIPFILVQRYNRPRLKKLLTYLESRNKG